MNTASQPGTISEAIAMARGILTKSPTALRMLKFAFNAVDDGMVGQQVFAENCVSCHGATGGGLRQSGAPNLTDQVWLYGGDAQSVYTSIYSGRQGHMPHWSERLSPTDIKLLTLYVGTLAERKP